MPRKTLQEVYARKQGFESILFREEFLDVSKGWKWSSRLGSGGTLVSNRYVPQAMDRTLHLICVTALLSLYFRNDRMR